MSQTEKRARIETDPAPDPEQCVVYIVRVSAECRDHGALEAESYGIVRIVTEWRDKTTDWKDEPFDIHVTTFTYPDAQSAHAAMAMSMRVYNIMRDHDRAKSTDAHIVYVQDGIIKEYGV